MQQYPSDTAFTRGKRLGITRGTIQLDVRFLLGRTVKKPIAEYLESKREQGNWKFTCRVCGKEGSRRPTGRARKLGIGNLYCSRICAKTPLAVRSPEVIAQRAAAAAVLREKRTINALQRRLIRTLQDILDQQLRSGTCADCGLPFTRWYNSQFCRDCKAKPERKREKRQRAKLSPNYAASRKAHKYRRRGATVETFDPVDVLRRDKWRCKLCGIKTPEKLRGTFAPNAPELDHIIPISIGGEHSRRNTQCACRACNLKKRNTVKGQMLLIG